MDRWKQFQNQPTAALLPSWFGHAKARERNFWVLCGPASGRVVLDVDNEVTLEWFRQHETIGPTLDTTCCVKTPGGWHFHYEIEEGQVVDQASHDGPTTGADPYKWDFRAANKGGVLVPPSKHPGDAERGIEPGTPYEWVRGPEHAVPWPGWGLASATPLHQRRRKSGSSPTPDGGGGGAGPAPAPAEAPDVYAAFGGMGSRRSQLAALVRKMPNMHEHDGRNNVFTAVLGHLAKHIPFKDAFEALAEALNLHFGTPLEEEEWRRCSESVWESEQQSVQAQPTADNGHLVSNEGKLWTNTKVKQGDTHVEIPRPWCDFDLRLRGIIDVPDGGVQYVVDVLKGDRHIRAQLARKELGEWRTLQTWLAHYQATVAPPPNDAARHLPHNVRIHRYLMSQPAERYKAVAHLGWSNEAGGFLCHEGVITARGLQPPGRVVPDPKLAGWAPYRYGFEGTPEEALATLRDVLTYHDEMVTAVFGAWWVAGLLKPQMTKYTALFPFMALEAPSESGKTTGFFSLMLQLSGAAGGQGEYTLPVLRDRASAHQSGPVWIDDVSDPGPVLDLLRQATSGGRRGKKGADRQTEETVELVAPIVLSGEGLGSLGMEKALLDRAVKLDVPSPTNRMSYRVPDRRQWDDIVELRQRYDNDLTQIAGHIIQQVLMLAHRANSLPDLRQGGGRKNDVFAMLLCGATILGELVDDTSLVDRVERWIAGQEGPSDENYLTRFMLPYLLRHNGKAGSAYNDQPAFVDDQGIVWMSETRVADVWRGIAKTPRERQLGSEDSVRSQRRAITGERRGTNKQIGKKANGSPTMRRYQPLTRAVSSAILSRIGIDLANEEAQQELL